MNVAIAPLSTEEELVALADMAAVIWNEYWPPRIGQAQTDYMVERFQSLEAIKRDIAEHGYEYWFIHVEENGEDRIVGYTGGRVEPESNRFLISKIYLFAEERGHGFASKAIRFYENLCRERNLRALYLTVNKYNDLAIRAYKGKGFDIIDSVETDIGAGFVMDDYIMELAVSAK